MSLPPSLNAISSPCQPGLHLLQSQLEQQLPVNTSLKCLRTNSHSFLVAPLALRAPCCYSSSHTVLSLLQPLVTVLLWWQELARHLLVSLVLFHQPTIHLTSKSPVIPRTTRTRAVLVAWHMSSDPELASLFPCYIFISWVIVAILKYFHLLENTLFFCTFKAFYMPLSSIGMPLA